MRCGRTVAGHPFAFGVRIDLAIPADFVFKNFIAIPALFDDRMAAVSEKTASFFRHEAAFHSLFDRIAKHLTQPPYIEIP